MKNSSNIDFCKIYLDWIKENIEQFKINENTFRLTLPFLDRNNDSIDLYIIKNNDDTFYVTDDGATLNELSFSGFEISDNSRRKKILNSILSAYGVTLQSNNELFIRCSEKDLPLKKHMLAQCMVKVSDMFFLSKSNVQSLFLEDVQNFFDSNDIRYVENICITGKSKLTTHYDFAIGKSKNAPERFIKVVNNMDAYAAKNIIFAWNDTKEVRQHDTKLYAFIQNVNKKISDDAVEALKEYGILPALWTNKEQYLPELIA